MDKTILKPQPFIGISPVVMVSCGVESPNIITIAWSGIVNSITPMIYISVRKERHSYKLIEEAGEFVVNIVDENLVKACDFCGIKSGKHIDKFAVCNLNKGYNTLKTPYIKESKISIDCKINKSVELGSHTMFIADIVSILADSCIVEKGKINASKANLIGYSNSIYYGLGSAVANQGFSLKK